MQLPLTVSPQSDTALQTQIYGQILQLIRHGALAPDTRVPSTRELATQLGVSRNTVVMAYQRLIVEGFLDTHFGAGTRVGRTLPSEFFEVRTRSQAAAESPSEKAVVPVLPFRGRRPQLFDLRRNRLRYDFRIGRPDESLFPLKTWRRLLIQNLGGARSALTQYGDPAGLLKLRAAVANHLRVARGIRAEPEQVIVVAGCQEALNLVARLLVKEGSKVVLENPCYQGAAFVFESFGGHLIPIEVDDEGINAVQLPRQLVQLAYVTPSHQFPLGVTMSLARRLKLLDWASETGAYVMEDDYDSDFRYQGPPLMALQALDAQGRVIYSGTFSKSIGAGLRMGYVVVPPRLVDAATTVKALMNNGHPWLEQAVVADFILSGGFDMHLRRIRQEYLQRQECLQDRLRLRFGDCTLSGLEGGMHAAWRLPADLPRAYPMQQALHRMSVGIYSLQDGPAHQLNGFPGDDQIALLGYPCLTEREIVEAVDLIAGSITRS